MPRKRKKKSKVKMSGAGTINKPTHKTTVTSEANLSYDEEKLLLKLLTKILKILNQIYDLTKKQLLQHRVTKKQLLHDEETTSTTLNDKETTSTASKRKPSELSSPELQPQSKIANFNTTELTPEEEQSTSLTDSERLIVDNSRRTSDELNSTCLSDTTNVTKDLPMDISDVGPGKHLESDENGPRIIASYTLVLPTLNDMIDKEGLENGTKDERITKKGKYAQVVLNSPLGSSTHTVEKERQHSERERQKSLYCTYEIAEDKTETFSNLDLLQAAAHHIGIKNISAFYKIREGVFIVVLKNSELKETYAQETNFQEEIRGIKVNFRILHNKPEDSRTRRRNHHPHRDDTVFVTMFLPTLISDAAVKRVFSEFGEVHDVFHGRYKDDHQFNIIYNGKRHVRLTPHGSKQDLPHKVQFHGENRYFHVMWAEKLVFCKRCAFHHMLMAKCSDEQKKSCGTKRKGCLHRKWYNL